MQEDINSSMLASSRIKEIPKRGKGGVVLVRMYVY